MTLYFVCPCCQASRTQHQICCGSWPLAVDLVDESLHALVALPAIEVVHRLVMAPPDGASDDAERGASVAVFVSRALDGVECSADGDLQPAP